MLFGMLAGSASILATWLILIVALTGVGLIVRRAFGLGITTSALFSCFWLGLAVTVLVLQVWHLFLPITWIALLLVMLLGVTGLVQSRGPLRDWVGPALRRAGPLLLLGLMLGAFWIANRSMDAVAAGDTGMYHIPAVTWAKEYAIVPGLANLHGRLGFNGSGLLFAAMVDVGPWVHRSTHLVNGLFLLVLFWFIGYRLRGYFQAGARPTPSTVFDLVLLTPLVITALDPWYISSLTTDLATAVVLFVATSRLLSLMERPQSAKPAESAFEIVQITALCSIAVCFKLSAAIFAGLLWLIAVGWFIRAHRTEKPWLTRGLAWSAGLTAGLGLVWIGRGVILSGFPFYPSTVAAAPVEWRVPVEQAEAEADWIGHFARTYYDGEAYNYAAYGERLLGDWTWFRPWLSGTLDLVNARWLVVLPFGLALSFLLVALLRGKQGAAPPGWRLLLIPALGGIAFWFVAGPRPPFGFFAFWVFAALAAALALGSVVATARPATLKLIAATAVTLALLPMVIPVAGLIVRGGASPGSLARLVIVPPGSDRWLQPPPGRTETRGQRELVVYQTASGLRLLTPAESNRCWFAEPLCTPHPAPNLRLRKANDIQSGFITEGSWQPVRWPNPQTGFLESWRAWREGRTVIRRPHSESTP
jgi:hypothetical protein